MAEVFKAKSFGVEGFEKVLVIKRILPELARSQAVRRHVHPRGEARGASVAREHRAGVRPRHRAGRPSSSGAKQPDAYYMAMEFVHGLRPRDAPRAVSPSAEGRCRSRCACSSPPRSRRVSITRIAVATRQMQAARHRAPRRVAAERLALARRRSEGHRLRHREGARRARANDLEDTRTRQLHGKFGYMSPEQARGEIGRCAQRFFLARRRPLRVPRGRESVQRADDVRNAAARSSVRVPARRALATRRAAPSSSRS